MVKEVLRAIPWLWALALPAVWAPRACPGPVLPTPHEREGGATTPRYAETVAWLQDLAAASPLLTYTTFGTSPQGRDLPLVVADAAGAADPRTCRRRPDQAVVLVQACIHAGETCGKDAGMALLRDLAEDPALAAGLLDRVTLLLIPIYNVDGHERFGPHNRVNQNGPQEMGWRTNALNLNLNRDYLKADAPETRAWLELWNRWDPDFFIDVHSTDGADYQYAVTYSLERHGNLEAGLTGLLGDLEAEIGRTMAAAGFPLTPYVSFREWHDPGSGLEAWAATPRYSQGYAAIRNRPGLLVETHMLKDYATRVRAAGLLLRRTLAWIGANAESLTAGTARADAATAEPAFRQVPFPLSFATRDDSCRTVEFLGVGYDTLTSAVTGGKYFRYDGPPQTMSLPYYDAVVPERTVMLPAAYIVPVQWEEAIDRLQRHGIELRRLAAPAELPVRTYRFADPQWEAKPFEGRHRADFTLRQETVTLTFPAGSAVVPLEQPGARVIAHLLEPQGPDSLVRWGFFDAVFFPVEYVEAYVIEPMIARMLAEDPALAGEFAAAKAASPDLAADPWAIRYWFFARTPYYDKQAGRYPVGLVDDPAILAGLPLE